MCAVPVQDTENLQSDTVQDQTLQISPNVSLDVSRQESFSDRQHQDTPQYLGDQIYNRFWMRPLK